MSYVIPVTCSAASIIAFQEMLSPPTKAEVFRDFGESKTSGIIPVKSPIVEKVVLAFPSP